MADRRRAAAPRGRPTTRSTAPARGSSRGCASPTSRACASAQGGRKRKPRRAGEPAPAAGRRGAPLRQAGPEWVGIAAGGWILLSFLAFAVSAQLQSFKLAGDAEDALHGNPFLLVSPQTILVLGTDARPPGTKEPGAATSEECFEQQSHGDAPHGRLLEGEFRADTLMLIRAGGGAFRKLSIPRDAFAEIPGQGPQKINAAFAFGGAGAADRDGRGLPRDRHRPRRDRRLHRLRRPDRRGRRRRGRRPEQALRRHLRRRRRRPGRRHAAPRQGREHPRRRGGAGLRAHPQAERMPRARARAPTRSATTTSTASAAQQAVINGIKGRLTEPAPRSPTTSSRARSSAGTRRRRSSATWASSRCRSWSSPRRSAATAPTEVLCAGDNSRLRRRPRQAASKCPSRAPPAVNQLLNG